jgi:hypothetical protein
MLNIVNQTKPVDGTVKINDNKYIKGNIAHP